MARPTAARCRTTKADGTLPWSDGTRTRVERRVASERIVHTAAAERLSLKRRTRRRPAGIQRSARGRTARRRLRAGRRRLELHAGVAAAGRQRAAGYRLADRRADDRERPGRHREVPERRRSLAVDGADRIHGVLEVILVAGDAVRDRLDVAGHRAGDELPAPRRIASVVAEARGRERGGAEVEVIGL